MDPKIQRLKRLIDRFLNQSKDDLRGILGSPSKKSDSEVWFYSKYRMLVYKDEIAFVFQEDIIVDIMVTEYFLWIEINNIFYYEGQDPEFKVVGLQKKLK